MYAALGLAYVYFFMMGAMTFKYSYAPYLFIPSIVLYLLWTGFSVFAYKRLQAKGKGELNKTLSLIIFFTTLAAMVGSDGIKLTFGRVRFYLLKSPDEYLPWYYVQSHNLNSSFPSGHVTRAAISLCLTLIPLYFGYNK